MAYKRKRGELISGRIPFGYEPGADKVGADGEPVRTIQPCPPEQEILSLIRDLPDGGLTLRGIAQELNGRHISRREGGQWEHGFIARTLKKTAA
jgi:hypothetical protein